MTVASSSVDFESRRYNEKALIGCLLQLPEKALESATFVSSGDFVDAGLGRAFHLIVSHCESKRSREDLVKALIRERPFPASELPELFNAVIDPSLAVYYASLIREESQTSADDAKKNWQRADQLFDDYLKRLKEGDVPSLYELPVPFQDVELGPGLLTALGAPPATGKTSLSMSLFFSALEMNPNVIGFIANAEMPFDTIIRREIVRRTNLDDKALRSCKLVDSDWTKIDHVAKELEPILHRTRWVKPPYNLDTLKLLRKETPGILVCDYLQKFSPDSESPRTGVTAVMARLRDLCTDSWGVLALSATSRTQGKGGSGHDSSKLSMASFRESSEVEYNSDACYLLRDNGPIDDKEWLRSVDLCCVKNRNGDRPIYPLEFNAAGMRFQRRTDPRPSEVGEYEFEDANVDPYDSGVF